MPCFCYIVHSVFVLIEARRANAGISTSETVLIYDYIIHGGIPLIYYKFSLLYDLLKQVCTKCDIFNCKVKQFQ